MSAVTGKLFLNTCSIKWYDRKMDLISIAFYAAICGTLGVAAPNLGKMPNRLAVGAAVGVVAAIVLPLLKGMTGY